MVKWPYTLGLKNLAWSQYQDVNPVPTTPLADVLATALSKSVQSSFLDVLVKRNNPFWKVSIEEIFTYISNVSIEKAVHITFSILLAPGGLVAMSTISLGTWYGLCWSHNPSNSGLARSTLASSVEIKSSAKYRFYFDVQ